MHTGFITGSITGSYFNEVKAMWAAQQSSPSPLEIRDVFLGVKCLRTLQIPECTVIIVGSRLGHQ